MWSQYSVQCRAVQGSTEGGCRPVQYSWLKSPGARATRSYNHTALPCPYNTTPVPQPRTLPTYIHTGGCEQLCSEIHHLHHCAPATFILPAQRCVSYNNPDTDTRRHVILTHSLHDHTCDSLTHFTLSHVTRPNINPYALRVSHPHSFTHVTSFAGHTHRPPKDATPSQQHRPVNPAP